MIRQKALPFKIPKVEQRSILLQKDEEKYSYDRLHQHPEFQLTVIKEGEGTFVHGEYVGSFKPGDVYLVGSNVPHLFRSDEAYYQKDSQLKAISLSVFFGLEQMKQSISLFPELAGLGNFLDRAQLGGMALGELKAEVGEEIVSLFTQTEFQKLISFLQILEKLASSNNWQPLLSQTAKTIRESEGARLEDIFSYTFNNFQKPISLEQVAETAHMNKSSFCRYFKQHTRKSYIDFLNEYRVQQACKQLGQTDKSIAQIAYEVGFNNLSNFNRHFKKVKKVSPRVYRQQLG